MKVIVLTYKLYEYNGGVGKYADKPKFTINKQYYSNEKVQEFIKTYNQIKKAISTSTFYDDLKIYIGEIPEVSQSKIDAKIKQYQNIF